MAATRLSHQMIALQFRCCNAKKGEVVPNRETRSGGGQHSRAGKVLEDGCSSIVGSLRMRSSADVMSLA